MIVQNAGKATIAASGTKSNAVDLGQQVLCALIMPAVWTAANITFEGGYDSAGTFYPVKRADGTTTAVAAYTIQTPSALDYIILNPADFAGLRFIKVVSSNAQAAERIITLIGRAMQ